MKKLVVLGVAAIASLGATLAAYAADATGAIKTLSLPDRTVTLEDGKKYTLTGAVDMTKFKVGDKVKITFVEANPVFVTSTGINGSASAMVPAT